MRDKLVKIGKSKAVRLSKAVLAKADLLRIVVVAILAIAVNPAFAHRPYYTQVEKIRLPNGEVGEVRLLNGDGIVVADPVRPIVVDQQSRLVARGPKTFALALSCDEQHQCLIVDLAKSLVFELDAASFREGPVQPAIARGGTDDWELEHGDESWGFSSREPTAAEMRTANMVLARERRNESILNASLAAIGAVFVVPVRLDIQSKRRRYLTRAGLILIGSLLFCFFIALSIWMAFLSGVTFELWAVSVAAGACMTWIIAGLVRRRSRLQAASS